MRAQDRARLLASTIDGRVIATLHLLFDPPSHTRRSCIIAWRRRDDRQRVGQSRHPRRIRRYRSDRGGSAWRRLKQKARLPRTPPMTLERSARLTRPVRDTSRRRHIRKSEASASARNRRSRIGTRGLAPCHPGSGPTLSHPAAKAVPHAPGFRPQQAASPSAPDALNRADQAFGRSRILEII